MIRCGCKGYRAFIAEEKWLKKLEEIPIVSEFSEEILGSPPIIEIDFTIKPMSRITSIFKSPFRMVPVELRELKVQLQDLLDKGFVCPSVLPWEAPVLHVKKDGMLRMCIDYK